MDAKNAHGTFKITAVICAYNEEQSLPHVLPRIPAWIDEIILVDAHSTDKTIEVTRQLNPKIKILFQPGKGKGDAMKYGIEQATGDIVVMLDADGQNNPDDVEGFITPLLNGCDFAKGSRLKHGRPQDMSFHRYLGNVLIAVTCNLLYRTKFSDLCSGYNAFWKKSFLSVKPWENDDWGYEPALIARVLQARLKVCEVPHLYAKRLEGKSKLPDMKQGLTAIRVLVRERFRG